MTTPNPPAGGSQPPAGADGGQGGGQQAPTTSELATRLDGLAAKVDALVNVIGQQRTEGGPGAPSAATQQNAADLQSQMRAEIKKIKDEEDADAAARGEKEWRARVEEFIGRHPEVAPAEPQRGLRGLLQRGLVGTPREQREKAPAVSVPAAAPPGGGGRR